MPEGASSHLGGGTRRNKVCRIGRACVANESAESISDCLSQIFDFFKNCAKVDLRAIITDVASDRNNIRAIAIKFRLIPGARRHLSLSPQSA